jgi:1-acyl-sn-glycerol-3-phosphate acyltransferase
VQNYQQFSSKTGADKLHQDLTRSLTDLMQQASQKI